jgi:hypothetical protein
MQSAYCCWHRLTACLEQCSTFPCCLPVFDSVGPTSPRHRRDFDPCFEPLVDDSESESEQDEPTTGPVVSPRGGNPTVDGVKFAAAAAVHPQAATLESAAPATAPKKSSPIRTKLPLLADSPKKIKFGPPKKPPRHFDFVALATDVGSAQPEQSTSTPVPDDRKTASAAAAASSSSNSGGSRKLSPRQLFDKLRGGGGGDAVDERRLVTSGGGDKVVKEPAADGKAPRKVCYDNQGDDLCSDDESRSKSHGLKNIGECRSGRGSSSGQLGNIYVGLGGNKSSSDDTSAANMEPEGIYAEVGWPKIAYYFINLCVMKDSLFGKFAKVAFCDIFFRECT